MDEVAPPTDESAALLGQAILRLPLGVIVASADGEAMVVNPAAETILAKRDGIHLVGGVLSADGEFEAEQLGREIARAAGAGPARTGSNFAILTMSRPSRLAPYVLMIAPLEARHGGAIIST
jgi:hypothetical protein